MVGCGEKQKGVHAFALLILRMLLWFQTLQETRRFQASDMAIHCMAWTREGSTRLLCVAAQDAHIHVIDSASGLPVRIIGGHTKTAFSLCVSGGGGGGEQVLCVCV